MVPPETADISRVEKVLAAFRKTSLAYEANAMPVPAVGPVCCRYELVVTAVAGAPGFCGGYAPAAVDMRQGFSDKW